MLTCGEKKYIISVCYFTKKKEDTIVEELNKEQTRDFGVVLYEKSNAKHALDAPTGKLSGKEIAVRIYMILLGLAMFGWFLYSLIRAANDSEIGLAKAIASHIASFFILIVAEFIVMLTAFNVWGKFARAALKHGLARQRGMEGVKNRELEAELAVADANKAAENAIRVYRDFIVVVNGGEETLIHRSQLQRVKCEPDPRANMRGYQVTFELYDGASVVAALPLTNADLPRFKKHLDNFEYTLASRQKGYFKKKLPTIAFLMVPVLIGVALIVVHSLVLPDMPLIFGVFFLSVGLLMVIGQFSDVAVIGNGVMGILVGLLFTALPVAIALTVADLAKEVTIASMLTYFSPLHAGLSVFFGFGPMLKIGRAHV